MATRTWLYGSIDAAWSELSNWDGGVSLPTNGDDVLITGSVMPNSNPPSGIALNLFDSTGADPGTAFTLGTNLDSATTVRIGVSGDATSNHVWQGAPPGSSFAWIAYGGASFTANMSCANAASFTLHDSAVLASSTITCSASSALSITLHDSADCTATITNSGLSTTIVLNDSATLHGSVTTTNNCPTTITVNGTADVPGTITNNGSSTSVMINNSADVTGLITMGASGGGTTTSVTINNSGHFSGTASLLNSNAPSGGTVAVTANNSATVTGTITDNGCTGSSNIITVTANNSAQIATGCTIGGAGAASITTTINSGAQLNGATVGKGSVVINSGGQAPAGSIAGTGAGTIANGTGQLNGVSITSGDVTLNNSAQAATGTTIATAGAIVLNDNGCRIAGAVIETCSSLTLKNASKMTSGTLGKSDYSHSPFSITCQDSSQLAGGTIYVISCSISLSSYAQIAGSSINCGGSGAGVTITTVAGQTVPSPVNVRNGTSVGAGASGTAYIPSAANVRAGTATDATTGTLAVPSPNDVRSGTNVDATTGNATFPGQIHVENGVQYGTNGTQYTGTRSSGLTTQRSLDGGIS